LEFRGASHNGRRRLKVACPLLPHRLRASTKLIRFRILC
jgi:hypothetical protein